MATKKEYLEFVLEQLSDIDGITHRQMMGEYIIYHHGKISAYLCDDRLLVKPVPSAAKMMPDAKYEPPYDGAKDMILVENIDDKDFLTNLFNSMYSELPEPKNRNVKKAPQEMHKSTHLRCFRYLFKISSAIFASSSAESLPSICKS